MYRSILLVMIACTLALAPAYGAQDFFMKLGDIKGEAMSPGHEEWIKIESFSWGESSRIQPSSGQPSGKRQHKPLTCTKVLDKSSPKIMEGCSEGTMYNEVKIELLSSDPTGRLEPYLIITMQDVIISSYSISGSGDADDRPTEEIAFTYQKITWTYSVGKESHGYEDDWKATK
jgi:type VI secretion system secreted protein Hcp